MKNEMLHIFRNTPFGREVFMQSAYFCKRLNIRLAVYVPVHNQFLIYFERQIVTVDLDRAFFRSPNTAKKHVEEILKSYRVEFSFFEPSQFTASNLPDLPPTFGYMCCPRTISDLSTKVGLGYIGPRVRNIILNAGFPVLLASSGFKEWKSITCFFRGSTDALQAVGCALHLSQVSGLPLKIFTQGGGKGREWFQRSMEAKDLFQPIQEGRVEWMFFEKGDFKENLYSVPHDSLVVVGASGHGLVKQLIFGGSLEVIQSVLPNPILIVGPRYGSN